MRVGIDGIVLHGDEAGSLRYFEQLLDSLADCGAKSSWVVFAAEAVLRSAAIPKAPCITPHTVRARRWQPAALRQQLYPHWDTAGKLDLLHAAVFAPPLWYPGKTIMTVFDLTFLRYPQTQKWTGRLWRKLLWPAGIRKADHLAAISNSTRSDLIHRLGISEHKISVVYPFIPAYFRPVSNPAPTLRSYRLPERYILFVGTLERRKNIAALLRAFDLAKRKAGLPHNLVLIGRPGWLYDDIEQTIRELGLQQSVIRLGCVPEAHLPALYSGAELFVYLSQYEGFGLPVLEALACGTPVLISNTSSLPEVAGQAALYTEPEQTEQAAAQMVRGLTDAALRADLVERGLEQASKFSKERFGREMLSVYERAFSA